MSPSRRWRIDLVREVAPDATTLLKFRRLLETDAPWHVVMRSRPTPCLGGHCGVALGEPNRAYLGEHLF